MPYTPLPSNVLRDLQLNGQVQFRNLTIKRNSCGSRRILDVDENQRPTADITRMQNEAFESQSKAIRHLSKAVLAQNRALKSSSSSDGFGDSYLPV